MRILRRAIIICIMNLLDKRKYLIWSGLACMLIPFFFACDDPNELGILVEGDEQGIRVRDTTFTLPISTIYIDSLRTDQFNSTIVGRSLDSIFGELKAESYFHYGPLGGVGPGDTLEFSSSFIVLEAEDISAKESLSNEHWDFHEALDTLYSQAIYLANKETPYDPNPILQYDFSFNPEDDSLISCPFDIVGQKLFDQLVKAEQDTVFRDSLVSGQLYYSPLVLVPGDQNEGLFTLELDSDTAGIYVEMRSPSTDSLYYYKFNLGRKGYYSRIVRDRSGSTLQSLQNEYEDEYVSDRAYGSMVHGVYLKVDLQPLQNFVDQHNSLVVNDSRLTLNTVDYSSMDFISPYPNVQFLFIRGSKINGPGTILSSERFFNALLNEASYRSSSGQQSLLTMSLQSDSTIYRGSTTLFTQLFADAQSNEDRDELVVINPFVTSVKQTVFTDAQLDFYYTLLE